MVLEGAAVSRLLLLLPMEIVAARQRGPCSLSPDSRVKRLCAHWVISIENQ